MTPIQPFAFATRVRPSDPMVRDHVVHGVRIMPGVTFLDLTCRALLADGAALAGLELRGVLFSAPVAVEDEAERELELRCAIAGGAARVTGSSRPLGRSDAASLENFACVLQPAAPMRPAAVDLAEVRARLSRQADVEDLYDAARRAGIHHAGFMKSHGTLHLGDDCALAELTLSAPAAAHASSFHLHPAHLDSSTLAAFLAFPDSLAAGRPYIPLHIRSFRAFGPLPETIHVYTRRIQVAGPAPDILHADYQILGPDGEVLAVIEGLAVKHIRSERLIRARIETTPRASTLAEPAASAYEDLIRGLVAEARGVPADAVDLDRGFYDQDLDSALLLQLTRRLETRLGVSLYPTLLFEHPTVRQLANHLRAAFGEMPAARTATPERVSETTTHAVRVYARSWETEGPAPVPGSPGADRMWWLPAGDAGRALARELRERGIKPAAVVCPGEAYHENEQGLEFVIRPGEARDYEALVAALGRRRARPAGMLHLWAAEREPRAGLLTHGFASAFLWSRALLGTSVDEPQDMLFAYCRGQGEPAPAAAAALVGFARTVRREDPRLRWRSVEVSTAGGDLEAARVAAAVVEELARPASSREVRYDAGSRQVAGWTEVHRQDHTGAAFKEGGIYLITGGLGALGATVAEHLARRASARLLLVGRAELDGERRTRLERLRALGEEVEYVRGDVSRLEDVAEAVQHARRRWGRIDGVIHAAGSTRDRLLRNKPLEEAWDVIAGKVAGTCNLDEATRHEPLDCFVLFASVSGLLGNAGQTDYAYANAFQWCFAEEREWRRARGERQGRTLAIAWPLWEQGGMGVDGEQRRHLRERHGLTPLSTDEGLEVLEELMWGSRSQVLVLAGDPDRFEATLADEPVGRPAPPASPARSRSHVARSAETDIAVIGMAGRYPMADDLGEFWANLREGRDCITVVPHERWDPDLFYQPGTPGPGKTNSKWGGFLRGVDLFDPLFFNIAPREAELMDPQERLFLETAWETFEDAGYTRRGLGTRAVGVFVGAMWGHYQLLRGTARDPEALPASIFASIANRVSYFFDLQGPSVALDTMCSSSLTAVHLAWRSILDGECELALAGGVNLTLHPNKYLLLGQGLFTSSDGRCRSFGEGGNGYVPGEGVGAVLLKPLPSAVRDGDQIYGVIRASALAHNGRSSGYTVPNPQAQAALVLRALTTAGVDARTVGYVEAHGTGTSLGDPIEVAGLTKAFQAHTGERQFCALGSVKSNIGHLESAAGIAALTKVLLQFRHQALVPSLHGEPPNRAIAFAQTPFRLQDRLAPWPQSAAGAAPRRAGVSAFGAGGTNVHIVVEEPPASVEVEQPAGVRPQVVLLSAQTEEALRAYVERYLRWADERWATAEAPSLARIAYTTQVGREALEERLAILASSVPDLVEKLRAFAAGHTDTTETLRGKASSAVLRELLSDQGGEEFTRELVRRGNLRKLAQVWVAGVDVDWSALHVGRPARRVSLPTYPFVRRRLWAGAAPAPAARDEARPLRESAREASASAPPADRALKLVLKPAAGARADAAPRPEAPPAVMPASVPSVAPARPPQDVAAAVRAAVAGVLYTQVSDLQDDKPFVDLGMDSILAVELVRTLNQQFRIDLKATQLYDHPTTADLASLVASLLAEVDAPPSAEVPASAPSPAPMSGDVAPGVDELEQLEEPEAAPTAPVAVARPSARDARQGEAIAVVGMAGRFPGADDVRALWRNLRQGVCSVSEVPAERWDPELHFDPHPGTPGKTYSKWGGFLDGVDRFDPLFFSISPAEAEAMDPQQRIFLEECWHALEDAGYPAAVLAAMKCGVFAGVLSGSEYAPDIFNSSSILAARIAYFLNLKGPAVAMDTACSSSLVAVHMACRSLLAGETDMMLAGGVTLYLTEMPYVGMSQAGMLARDGRCKAFDDAADGFVPAEAAAVVVLRRLSDAVRDGDRVYGVIRGSGLNQDGRTNGITAPSLKSQRSLALDVYRDSGIDPRTLSYVEAHGTGTRLGDPIEVGALTEAFRAFTSERQYCALGALKANLGHTSAAAGVAGLIKVLLSLQHEELPPVVHLDTPNREIDFESSPFYCNRTVIPWPARPDERRRAAVSSFGYSGTNAHLVVEEPPPARAFGPVPEWSLFALSGRSRDRIQQHARDLLEWLEAEGAAVPLASVAYTLLARRTHFPARAAFVVRDRAALLARLREVAAGTASEATWWSPEPPRHHPAPLRDVAAGLVSQLRETQLGAERRHELLAGLAALYVSGAEIAWRDLYPPHSAAVVSLPGYPFLRERHWRDARGFVATRPVPIAGPPDAAVPPQTTVLDQLKGVFCAVLKLDPARLDPDAEFENYGLDSIMIGRINQLLEARFGPLSATLLFKYKSLSALAAYLAEHHPLPLASQAAADVPAPMPVLPRVLAGAGQPTSPRGAMDDAIAIVGICGRFPGASDLDQYWDNLRSGRESIVEVPATRWDHRRFYAPGKGAPGKTYSRWGGFLEDIERFDPLFFNISPLEARFMDPQERLFLETAWGCLENAGYTREGLADPTAGDRRGSVGVFVGVTFNDYPLRGLSEWQRGNPIPLGTQTFSIANRVSYLLNLRGPSLAVDTACSSSLTALHLACEAIRHRECELALAGGVNLILHPAKYITLAANHMHSSDGHCRSFGAGGDGFVSGEGVCAVLLKRLADAERDGDFIHAVVRGSAMNHDGHTHGYTVPNPVAQAEVIRAALSQAQVEARSISYVEAHGTGTALGDPIEITGLTDAYRTQTEERQYCAIGSVKSNVGHLEAAAGVAQLAKVVLQLKHGTLVPSLLHSDRLNPAIDFERSPFFVQRAVGPWTRPRLRTETSEVELPRRAGISSFGAGGVNVHVIVEEAPRPARAEAPSLVSEVVAAVRAAGPASVSAMTRPGFERLQEWAALLLLGKLQDMGLFTRPDETISRAAVETALALVPRYSRLLNVLLRVLERAGFLRSGGGEVITTPLLGRPELRTRLQRLDSEKAELLREHPFVAPHARLLEACVGQYDRVLSGQLPATAALFPGSSMELVDAVYAANAGVDALLADVVRAWVERRRAGDSAAAIRIVEVGAGTGGASAHVLRGLAGVGAVRYAYTDVSPAFLWHGEQRFTSARDWLEFHLFDVERDPSQQGFEPGSADIVIAANVLHATRRIDATLSSVQKLLKPGGLLVAKEVTTAVTFSALTFGLLDGWWRFEDDGARLPDSPLLSREQWRSALHAAGFDPTEMLPDGDSAETVLVAAKRHQVPARAATGPVVVPLSAKSQESLRTGAARLRDRIASVAADDAGALRLCDVAHTLQVGREAMPLRLAVVADSLADLAAKLDAYLEGRSALTGVYQGRAHSGGDGSAAPSAQAPKAGDPHEAARRWVDGGDVEWDVSPGRRIPLPSYAFGGERYWVAASDAEAAAPLEHVTTAEPAVPPRLRREDILQLPANEREDRVLVFLQEQLASVLGFPPALTPEPDQGLFDMGLESIAAVKFQKIIEEALGIRLADTTVFTHPTLVALARYLVGELVAGDEPSGDVRAATGGVDASAGLDPDEALARALAAEVEQLEAMLGRR